MKVRITSYDDKNKVFDMMKYITDRYPLEKESKVVLNKDDTISVYLVVSDKTKEEKESEGIPFSSFSSSPDEEIPF